MRDAVEERLATQLRALGETVGDELPPPADLEVQVVRRRRQTRAARRWSALAVAAVVAATVVTVSIVHGTTGTHPVHIATSPTTRLLPRDSLQPGTVMLSARGLDVISLDAQLRQNATMVHAPRGVIRYARATSDHRALWYLSLKKGLVACGDVVRADIATGHSSTIVTHAVAFDVSPDGSRLALYGAGDLVHDRCAPVGASAKGRLVVLDLTNGSSSSVALGGVTSMRFSPDGSYLAASTCAARRCGAVDRIDVPSDLGGTLSVVPVPLVSGAPSGATVRAAAIEFGRAGLYVLQRLAPVGGAAATSARIDWVDPRTGVEDQVFTSAAFDVREVVPTADALYVVAAPRGTNDPDFGLYLVVAGQLIRQRVLTDPGFLTPVFPLRP